LKGSFEDQIMKDNALSLEEFWDVVRLLCHDVQTCLTELEAAPKDNETIRAFWRRMYARAVFAAVEGSIYRMLFHAYAARERPGVNFSPNELKRLESYYDFDEDREAISIFSRTQMLEDMDFAFDAFARVYQTDYILPSHEQTWILVESIAHQREYLQFPKEPNDLEVYEEYVSELEFGLEWFVKRMMDLLAICREHAGEKFWPDDPYEDEVIM
jgi:hypothetical protein